MWIRVISHFENFLSELGLTQDQRDDAFGKATRVARSLAAKYYPNPDFDTNVAMVGGSLGKGTAIKPTSDVDLIFIVPREHFFRIERLTGNKQSQLLQQVKDALLLTYPNTDIRGDGPVVKVPFSSYEFEVLPVFVCDDGSHLTAHTKNGGSWQYCAPHVEFEYLKRVDAGSANKATHLIKMLKAWKRECSVDIKSVCLEICAATFIDQWINKDKSVFYYDWMVRDFFQHMLTLSDGGWTKPAGIPTKIPMGDNWQSKARSAYQSALKACEYERDDDGYNASLEWRKIFGAQFSLDILKFLVALAGSTK